MGGEGTSNASPSKPLPSGRSQAAYGKASGLTTPPRRTRMFSVRRVTAKGPYRFETCADDLGARPMLHLLKAAGEDDNLAPEQKTGVAKGRHGGGDLVAQRPVERLNEEAVRHGGPRPRR